MGRIVSNISIHAPTRGATPWHFLILKYVCYFNPRSHEGSDALRYSFHTSVHIFQSTLPRGERLLLHLLVPQTQNFNPRSHEGSDHISPYKGCCRIYFNPRSHEGSDLDMFLIFFISCDFNPRSHEGSDKNPSEAYCSTRTFQSTLPRGERQQFSPKSSLFSQQKLSKIFNLNNKLF